MKEKIEPCMHLIDNAKKAMELAGVTPKVQPIRGGTDGARLSFMGLPCPNLGTGGYAFHGPYEHITVEGMDAAVEVLKNLVILYRDM
jgi:tripeptide aminopeptidase